MPSYQTALPASPGTRTNVATIARSTTTVTVTTSAAHGLVAGSIVVISGASEPTLNGQFIVASAADATTFTYATSASGTVASSAVGYFQKCTVAAGDSPATSSAFTVPRRFIAGNRVQLRIRLGGTQDGSHYWTVTVTPRISSLLAHTGAAPDSTYATSKLGEHTLSLASAGAGTFYYSFSALEDFKIVATKTGTPGDIAIEVMPPLLPASN